MLLLLAAVVGAFAQEAATAGWPAKPWPEGMRWIPGGEFTMGGVGPEANPEEFPLHKVRVTGFWMDTTEVTNSHSTPLNVVGSKAASTPTKLPPPFIANTFRSTV